MGLFGRRHYDHQRIMADAVRARKAGKPRREAALYREILVREPNNVEIHRRLAPLLAQTRQARAAWHSYKQTVEALVRQKQLCDAAETLREAGGYLPRQASVWATLAAVELKRGREAEARTVLLEGRAFLRSRRELPQAIKLLQRALALRPDDFETGFDLADSLARAGQRASARPLLERLAGQAKDATQLRRVRARQFRTCPTPAAAWRWFRASRAPIDPLRHQRAI